MMYKEFIQNIIDTRGQWNIPDGEYFEMHHIHPRCLNGKGDYNNGGFKTRSTHENCIWLYPREHFIAHKLLAEENPNISALVCAYWNMCTCNKSKNNTEISADEYEAAKIFLHEHKIGCWKDCNPEEHPMYGKDRSGKNNPFYGKSFSDETLAKLSNSLKTWKETHPEEFSKQQSRPLGANGRAIALICVEENKYFECLKLASQWLKDNTNYSIDQRKIRAVLDTNDIAYGYHWVTAEKKNYKKTPKKDHGWWKNTK